MISKSVFRAALLASLSLGSYTITFAQESLQAEPVAKAERSVSTNAAATRPLNNLYVNQWIQLRASGELIGNVVKLSGQSFSPASEMRVALVKNGQIVSETVTQAQGQVILKNVRPGLYTLVARGENMIGSFPIVVLDTDAGQHLPAEFSIPVANVASQVLDSMFAGQFAPGRSTVAATAEPTADPLGRNRNYNSRDYKITLDSNGTLHGDLSLPGMAPADSNVGGTNVTLYANGREIARTQSDANGHYMFENTKPGTYSIVANGSAGFAAFGLCAVESATQLSAAESSSSTRFVSMVQDSSPSSAGSELSPIGNTAAVEEFVLEPTNDDAGLLPPGGPLGGGPMGGPMGGAGGGAGGGGGILGGGLGPIAVLGGLAGVAAAVASDDNNDQVIPPSPPPSPTTTVTP